MTVQQGRLSATDTTKDMASFYSDVVVTKTTQVDRILHDGSQFVRLVMRRPQAIRAFRGSSAAPDTLTSTPHYIDGLFTANATSSVNLAVIDFGGIPVSSTSIVVYSTSPINATSGNWNVSVSADGTDSQFSNSAFICAVSAVSTVFDTATSQFKTTVTVGLPSIDPSGNGLPFWRLKHATAGEFNNITEVRIITPLSTPVFSYFNTDGSFASSGNFEKENILDAAYDTTNGVYYTIRFNDDSVGTISLSLNDDFSEAEAGTAAGSNAFNPARWSESSLNSQFLRSSETLLYNVAAGKGQLETTYDLSGNLNVGIDVIPTSLASKQRWFALRALDSANNTIMSEGVSLLTSPTTTGVWFTNHINNLVNSTAGCELREMRPLWHNTVSGVDTFTLSYNGSAWLVSGTQTGALTNASTGALYSEATASTTPIEFIISCSTTPSNGEQFVFDLNTHFSAKTPTSTGIIGIRRSGATFSSYNVLGVNHASDTTSTGSVSIELFGNTNGTVNLTADNYAVYQGTSSFPTIPVFTVEKADNDGQVVNPALISSFNIINDPSKTFNDYIGGRVQIAATSSGSGGGFIFIKVDNKIYKYANNIALGTETGGSAVITTTDQIPQDGTSSFSWTHKSSIGGLPFLTYLEHDSILSITHLKTLNEITLLNTTDDKEVLLNISNQATNQFKVFFDQNDFDTLYYVDASNNLQAFGLDDRLSAFMALNADDVSLPAGTAQSTTVRAEVINAWGEPLDGKNVVFSVTAGDGAVTPSTDVTVSGGLAESQFIVGSTVGISTVTSVVTEA